MRKASGEGNRHRVGIPYMNQEMSAFLSEVEKETNMEGYTKAQRRVFGYISEILLNVWALHNKLKVKYMDVINTETSIKYRITHRN